MKNSNEELNEIKLAGIVRNSITDGPGIRFTIFVQGCPHHCEACHNESTWDFEGGKYVTIDRLLSEIDKDPLLKGVTFSGGEPICQSGVLKILAKKIKERNLDLVVFTGYKYEELIERNDKDILELLDLTDLLIDGPFQLENKDLSLKFRGSSNQRIIDMNKTRKYRKLMLANDYML